MADEPILAEVTAQPVEQPDTFELPTEVPVVREQLANSIPATPQVVEVASYENQQSQLKQLRQLGVMTVQLRSAAMRGKDA